MNVKKRTGQNYADAGSEKICPPVSSETQYFRSNKPEISLRSSSVRLRPRKSRLPKF